jgi:hypothetical protein
MLTDFRSKLKEEGLTHGAVDEQVNEVKQFLLWVKDRT